MNTTNTTTALNNLSQIKDFILTIINSYLVPIFFAVAFIYFLWMIFRFFIAGRGSEEATTEGRKFLVWSIVGFVVMLGVWGIVNLVLGSLPIDTNAQPSMPAFNPSATTNTTNTTTYTSGNVNPFDTSPTTNPVTSQTVPN